MITQLHTPLEAASWLRARITGSLYADSRSVQPGDGLMAWPGAASDARQYVNDVLKVGANACLVDADEVEKFGFSGEKMAVYAGLNSKAALIAAA